jgi:hypothetical protein
MADRKITSTPKPHTYSLMAAAEVLTGQGVRKRIKGSKLLPWQDQSGIFYDTVGEFRFGVGWLANGMSRVNLAAARPPSQVGDEPTQLRTGPDEKPLSASEARAAELVSYIAGGPAGQGQLLMASGQHLSIGGLGWVIAEPPLNDPFSDVYESWGVYAQDNLKIEGDGDTTTIYVRTGEGSGAEAWRPLHANGLVIKMWRKHPLRPWEPDAPVRAVLGILDQIDLLSAHITASGRSRLAGAGILAIPSEIEFPPAPVKEGEDGEEPTQQSAFDHFVDNLMTAMTVPIKDRDSAAGVVPFIIQVPGEYIDKLTHISFSTPFDKAVSALLTGAIKRLALGMDMPPEVLTGMSGVNHWTAWQVEETAVTLHIEPNAEIVCQALTEGYLRPALIAENLDPEAAIVWYDTSDLTSPPDRSTNVIKAYEAKEASGSALRSHLGLSDEDKPSPEEFRTRVLLDLASSAPAIAPAMLAEAGILDAAIARAASDAIGEASRAEVGGGAPAADPAVEAAPPLEDRPGGDRASAVALLMASDGVVYRAMERAGARLKSHVGRRVPGGPQAVTHSDIASLHTVYSASMYSDLNQLLDGAFVRTPALAADLGVEPDAYEATLRSYCVGLLTSQEEHTRARLVAALGAGVTV